MEYLCILTINLNTKTESKQNFPHNYNSNPYTY